MNRDLFETAEPKPTVERIGEAAFVLRGHALAGEDGLFAALRQVESQAPWRHMTTPNGLQMSVAMTNCGTLGWTTDRHGYRYTRHDPLTGRAWPPLPDAFVELACSAAAAAGFGAFAPDACLVNRYVPGARLSLHQDKDERDHAAPIVSVSLGLRATFLFGGHARSDRAQRIALVHGDVVVWGGPDRLRYHGVLPLADAEHPRVGAQRINLTFRKAG
jgi:alkylated DNA repair protein (DNA oxidative demethylase)